MRLRIGVLCLFAALLVLNLKRYELQVKIRNTAVSEANSLDIEIQKE